MREAAGKFLVLLQIICGNEQDEVGLTGDIESAHHLSHFADCALEAINDVGSIPVK